MYGAAESGQGVVAKCCKGLAGCGHCGMNNAYGAVRNEVKHGLTRPRTCAENYNMYEQYASFFHAENLLL